MDLIQKLRERRAAIKNELQTMLDAAETEARSLNETETADYDSKLDEIRGLDARIDELIELEAREAKADEARARGGNTSTTATVEVNEPDIYERNGRNSYFRDVFMSVGARDMAASERLRRHASATAESRAVGNTNGAGGSGGEWAPPTWVVDEWINLIRPSRITANLFKHEDVPFGTSSINYPKLLTGTSVGLQSTQNTALASTDPTTGYVQTGFATIGGKNVVSQQLLDQGRNFDRVIVEDLAAAYAQQVGTQVFTGAGTGSGTNAVVNGLGAATVGTTQTWTQATPTVAGFYGQANALLSAFITKRLASPTHWVMSPRRWYWLVAQTDTTGRPLVVPNGNAYNPMAVQEGAPLGIVGTFLGYPVVIDPLVPTNLGAGTNQDTVYLIKADDLVLLESAPQVEAFREPYADSLGVLFRMYAYVATILNRHTESIGVLTGTGLVAPTFAS